MGGPYPETTQAVGRLPSLIESLGLGTREMISLVGAGGKTTFMFRLARELAHEGKRVVATTTTKILEPSPEESPLLFVDPEDERIRQFVREHLPECSPITIAKGRLESGKLKGISSPFASGLWKEGSIDFLIVEADGAAGRPVKAPRDGEPVIPAETTLTVALLGIDGMDVELKEETVFRCEQVSRLTGIRRGDLVTAEAMAVLITHPSGIFRGAPVSSRVVAFLNKADVFQGEERGRSIAQRILHKRHHRIERVILGQLKKDPPVIEVIFPQ